MFVFSFSSLLSSIVKEAATRLSLRSIRLGEFKLNHVAEPRVRTRCVVGGEDKNTEPFSRENNNTSHLSAVRDAAMRLSMRSIRLGEFKLKQVAAPRVTHAVVVGLASKPKTETTATATTTMSSTSSNSTTTASQTTMTRDAKALLLRVAEHLLAVDNQATRALIVDLIRLAQ